MEIETISKNKAILKNQMSRKNVQNSKKRRSFTSKNVLMTMIVLIWDLLFSGFAAQCGTLRRTRNEIETGKFTN